MKKIIYIGNNLRSRKTNISSIRILGPLLESEGYEIIYASHYKNKIFRLIHMFGILLKYSKSAKVVMIDTYSTWNFYYAFIISQTSRVLKIPYITNLNGGNLPHRLDNSSKFSRLIFKNAYLNVAPSIYLKEAFQSRGYKNVIHIPNTLNISNYEFQKRNFQSVKLLWVRSFSKIYNPQLAVKVLKMLLDNGIHAELCMVGPDSGDGSLKATKNLATNLGVKVNFTGKLKKSKWLKISENFNMFINTTNFDNMPVSVIEAMALGLPVISTNVGGMPFLIDHEVDGILVEPDNAEPFVRAINWVMKNPELTQKMTLEARKKVEAYDWEKVRKQWLEVLS